MKRSTDRILFDTNVLLDAVLERRPHYRAASLIINAVEERVLSGFVAATSVTTCHYIMQRQIGTETALVAVQRIVRIFEVAPITRRVLEGAFELRFRDFEDAVLHEAARQVSATGIVTSNVNDFDAATLQIMRPEQLASSLG